MKSPKTSKDLVQRVLNIATERSDNPDLRDRGFVYWRLLSSNPKAARAVVTLTFFLKQGLKDYFFQQM